MTEEEKKLVEIDLCARLPYGVYAEVEIWNGDKVPKKVYGYNQGSFRCDDRDYDPDEIKPFLRPLEDMTEDELIEYATSRHDFEASRWFGQIYDLSEIKKTGKGFINVVYKTIAGNSTCTYQINKHTPKGDWYGISWLDRKYFDHRGLIENGLAIKTAFSDLYLRSHPMVSRNNPYNILLTDD